MRSIRKILDQSPGSATAASTETGAVEPEDVTHEEANRR